MKWWKRLEATVLPCHAAVRSQLLWGSPLYDFPNSSFVKQQPPSLAVMGDGRGLDDTAQSYTCKNQGSSHSCVLSPNGISSSRLPNLLLVSSNKSYDKSLAYVLFGHLALFVPWYSVAWMCWHYLLILINEHLDFFFLLFGAMTSNAAVSSVVYLVPISTFT